MMRDTPNGGSNTVVNQIYTSAMTGDDIWGLGNTLNDLFLTYMK